MADTNRRPPTPKEDAEIAAANQADTVHPSHYQPAKRDLLTDADARENALAAGSADVGGASDRGVRAQPPDEPLESTRVSEPKGYAGGVPSVLATVSRAYRG